MPALRSGLESVHGAKLSKPKIDEPTETEGFDRTVVYRGGSHSRVHEISISRACIWPVWCRCVDAATSPVPEARIRKAIAQAKKARNQRIFVADVIKGALCAFFNPSRYLLITRCHAKPMPWRIKRPLICHAKPGHRTPQERR